MAAGAMAHHDNKPLWLITPRLDASEYRDKLIGSVVKYPDLPLERHIPYKSTKLPLEMVSNLDPKPVQVRNARFWNRRIKDAGVEASLNELFEFFGERAKQESTERVATVARVWHMDSPGEKFKELLKNKQFFEELYDLLRSNHNVGYFITDVVTLANMQVTEETGHSKGAGASVQVPIDQTLGLISAGGGAHAQVSREKGYSASYEDELIVFLGYRKVELEKVDGARAKLGRAFLGQKHGFAVRDGMDYWPKMEERPVPGNANEYLGDRTPGAELSLEEREELMIVHELGFDVSIGGRVDEEGERKRKEK